MSNIVKAEQAAIQYTPEQIDLVRSQIAPKATDTELQLFLYQCQKTGLDALSRQIYAIHRNVWNAEKRCNEPKMTIQVSIDGFRVVAERSKLYAGQSEPEFVEEGNKIKLCKVRVYKFNPVTHERYEAAVGVAYWSEYAQTTKDGQLMGLWAKMPHVMLSKVAEAIALRRAFPQDLSGLYTSEEMQQADTPVQEQVQEAEIVDVPTREERQLLINLVYSSTLSEEKKFETIEWINTKCNNYKAYEKMQMKLEDSQQPLDQIANPNQKDISNHIKKVAANN